MALSALNQEQKRGEMTLLSKVECDGGDGVFG